MTKIVAPPRRLFNQDRVNFERVFEAGTDTDSVPLLDYTPTAFGPELEPYLWRRGDTPIGLIPPVSDAARLDFYHASMWEWTPTMGQVIVVFRNQMSDPGVFVGRIVKHRRYRYRPLSPYRLLFWKQPDKEQRDDFAQRIGHRHYWHGRGDVVERFALRPLRADEFAGVDPDGAFAVRLRMLLDMYHLDTYSPARDRRASQHDDAEERLVDGEFFLPSAEAEVSGILAVAACVCDGPWWDEAPMTAPDGDRWYPALGRVLAQPIEVQKIIYRLVHDDANGRRPREPRRLHDPDELIEVARLILRRDPVD